MKSQTNPPFSFKENNINSWCNQNFYKNQIPCDTLPKITLITPSLNQCQFLEQTILSILSQNYPNLEYIIIDGGSTDGSIEIIRKYENWLSYWISEPDRGQSHAINKGLDQSTGDIFNWVNSDDLLAPNTLWTVAKKISQQPDANIICGHYTAFSEEVRVSNLRMKIFESLEKTLIFGQVSPCCMFWKMEVLKSLGKIDERLHYCMDLELWYRYLEKFGTRKLYFIKKNLAFFRLHSASKSISHSFQFIVERFNLQWTLLKSLDTPESIFRKFEVLQIPIFYSHQWNSFDINQKKLAAYVLHDQLEKMIEKLNWLDFLSLYFSSLRLLPLQRNWRFYFLPLRRINRFLKKRK